MRSVSFLAFHVPMEIPANGALISTFGSAIFFAGAVGGLATFGSNFQLSAIQLRVSVNVVA